MQNPIHQEFPNHFNPDLATFLWLPPMDKVELKWNCFPIALKTSHSKHRTQNIIWRIAPMVQSKPRLMSFEDYLAMEPGELPEGRFEFCDGELIPIMSESGGNDAIANYLLILLMNAGIPFRHIRPHSCELEVTGRPRTRLPDLIVLQELHIPLIKRRNTITIEMPPPPLVMEVVSPGKANRERDFVAKRRQYADRGIPEYWLIDPEMARIIVLVLGQDGTYVEHGVFKGDSIVISTQFPILNLTAEQILAAGKDSVNDQP